MDAPAHILTPDTTQGTLLSNLDTVPLINSYHPGRTLNPYRDYKLKFSFGTGRLKSPWAVVVTKNGDFIVSDAEGNKVCGFGPTGAFRFQLPGRIRYPYGLVLDEYENLFVACLTKVSCFNKDRQLVQEFGQDRLSSPFGMTRDPQGNLAVVDGNHGQIIFFTTSGEWVKNLCQKGPGPSQLGTPTDVRFDLKGDFIVVDASAPLGGAIKKFDSAGNFLQVIQVSPPATLLVCPFCCDVDDNGHVVVADAQSQQVQAFTQAGDLLFSFSTGLGFPFSATIDKVGNLIVTETGLQRVSVFG